MNVIDLPEPKPRAVSPTDKVSRQWNLTVAFLGLTAGYAALHKLIVPAALAFTALRNSPYASLSLWFLHPVALAVLASRQRRLSPASCLLAGAGIAHGALELWAVAQGQVAGWQAFSRLLAAVPFSLVCVALLTGPFAGKSPRAAWIGVALIGALAFSQTLGGAP